MRGRNLNGIPDELMQELARAGGLSLPLTVRRGDAAAVRQALEIVSSQTAVKAERLQYIQLFGELDQPDCIEPLLNIVPKEQDPELVAAAVATLGRYADDRIAETILAVYPRLAGDALLAGQLTLASRRSWAAKLLEAVETQKVDPASIPREVVQKMTIHQDDQIAALIQKHWQNVQGVGKLEMQQTIARISEALAKQTGDPYHGKKLYDESCAKCHKLFGKGNSIGPELTAYKRDDTLGILLNIVNPSAEIREGYESYLVLTDDGRVMTGLMIDQDQHSVVLRGADGQNISIPRSNIDQLIKQSKSLMPEGLLDNLTEEQVRNLFAYLKIAQPF